MESLIQRISTFNRGRDPKLLRLKYQLMRADVFTFYRGTCHLFYEDWPAQSVLNHAPLAWICGDLHLENFGSYKGDNRLVYFDINDFDEAALAPCTWDIARLVTSILVGSHTLGVEDAQAASLCHTFLENYTAALATGHSRTVETGTATGLVKDLLTSLKKRKRKTFLEQRTQRHASRRQIRIDGVHTLNIPKMQRRAVVELIEAWRVTQAHPAFYQVLDVARRVAGTASLGLENYVLLVEGKGSPDHNTLLNLKEAPDSALAPYLKGHQPHWPNQAERVIAIQQRVQGTSPALLSAIPGNGKCYVLHELQPFLDRVQLTPSAPNPHRLEVLISTLGQIVAWDELRATGRQGSASADSLIAFAHDSDWRELLLDYARKYARQVIADYQVFCEAYDSHKLS